MLTYIYLNCAIFQKAAERGGYGAERYEKLEFQKKVAEHYYALRDSSWEVTVLNTLKNHQLTCSRIEFSTVRVSVYVL
jgi:thymidylate kinase